MLYVLGGKRYTVIVAPRTANKADPIRSEHCSPSFVLSWRKENPKKKRLRLDVNSLLNCLQVRDTNPWPIAVGVCSGECQKEDTEQRRLREEASLKYSTNHRDWYRSKACITTAEPEAPFLIVYH